MSTTAAGNPTEAGPAQTGNPSQTGQPTGQNATATQPNQAAANPPATADGKPTTPAANQPPADWQQQLQQAQESARKAQESARYFQGNYDRAQQQIQALAGAQPKADPMADDIKFFVSQGYNEADAKALVEYTNRKVQPLLQQNQQLQSALNGTTQVGNIMQTVANDPQFGRFMQDPEVFNGVNQALQQVALNGQTPTADWAKDIARMIAFDKFVLNGQAQATQPTAQPSQPQQFFGGGMVGPQHGYRPAPVVTKQVTPEQQALNQEIRSHFGLPASTQQ